MQKEEFYFDSRDGENKIHAVRYLPDNGQVKAVVQIIHGMAEYIERYEGFAQYLTQRGYAVTGDDHLGHGGSVPEGGSYGYFCEQDPATVVVRDVHRLKKMTQEKYPGVPYVILGHSMGSFILRNYLCKYGSGIDAAIIMGTGMQSPGLIRMSKALAAVEKAFRGPKHVSHLIDKCAFGSYNQKIPNPRTSTDWLTRDEAVVDRYNEDPLCGFVFTVNGFQTLFELIARIQRKENLDKIPKALPVLMVSGGDDPVGDYGQGVQKAYDSMKEVGMSNMQLKLYEGGRHELLNETNKDEVMNDLVQWMDAIVLA